MIMQLTEQQRKMYGAKAAQVKERLTVGADYWTWPLYGKNAVIAFGTTGYLRLLPRWDRYIIGPNGIVQNMKYDSNTAFYFEALEHWWDGNDGQKHREWCLRIFDRSAACPVCEGVTQLASTGAADDTKDAKDQAAREVYLMNAIVGPSGKRREKEGHVEVRAWPASPAILDQIMTVMLGGQDGVWARGDVTDVKEGFDLALRRPNQGAKGERWRLDAAPQPSALFSQNEAKLFVKWPELLIDIPAKITASLLTYEALYKLYYGIDPEPGETADRGDESEAQAEETRAAPPFGDAGAGAFDPVFDPVFDQTPPVNDDGASLFNTSSTPPASKAPANKTPTPGRGKRR
jgi:hypothetical protein